MRKYRYLIAVLVAISLINTSPSMAKNSKINTLLELNTPKSGSNIECPEDATYKDMKKLVADMESNFPSYALDIAVLKSELIAMNANCEISNNTALYLQNIRKFIVSATNLTLRIQAEAKAKSIETTTATANQIKYKNCTELNKKYASGVAKTGYKNKGLKVKKNPLLNDSLYQANIKLDKDKDGIACEK